MLKQATALILDKSVSLQLNHTTNAHFEHENTALSYDRAVILSAHYNKSATYSGLGTLPFTLPAITTSPSTTNAGTLATPYSATF